MSQKRHLAGSGGGKGGQFAANAQPDDPHVSELRVEDSPIPKTLSPWELSEWTLLDQVQHISGPDLMLDSVARGFRQIRARAMTPDAAPDDFIEADRLARMFDEVVAKHYVAQRGGGGPTAPPTGDDLLELAEGIQRLYNTNAPPIQDALMNLSDLADDVNILEEHLDMADDGLEAVAEVAELASLVDSSRKSYLYLYLDVVGAFESGGKDALSPGSTPTIQTEGGRIADGGTRISQRFQNSLHPRVRNKALVIAEHCEKLRRNTAEVVASAQHLAHCLKTLHEGNDYAVPTETFS